MRFVVDKIMPIRVTNFKGKVDENKMTVEVIENKLLKP